VIQGESEVWVWTCFTLSEPRLDCYLVDVGHAPNKIMCWRSVVAEWIL
jgi:hypothetical protein